MLLAVLLLGILIGLLIAITTYALYETLTYKPFWKPQPRGRVRSQAVAEILKELREGKCP